MEAAQKKRPTVSCEGDEPENVAVFKYLGSLYTADGNSDRDITRRIALAMQRQVWTTATSLQRESHHTGHENKIYKTAIMSVLTL